MCLAVPGKVVEWLQHDSPFERAVVEFEGIRRHIHMACVPDARLGDYVLVHAGVALTGIDAQEAARILQTLAELDLQDIASPPLDSDARE